MRITTQELLQYLPAYWYEYYEMEAIMGAEAPELNALDTHSDTILLDAFLETMTEPRIREWEKWLNLPPTGTLDDRRMAIVRYFSVVSKLTKESIQTLVAQLYKGARAIICFSDSTIKITIKPLPEYDTETIDFQILLRQLSSRKPCHIGLFTERFISTWGDVAQGFDSWGEVNTLRKSWQEVYDFILE